MSKSFRIFIIVSALTGLAIGLSDAVFANYFKEAYSVNAQQRGFIEFPRELPGVLATVFIALMAAIGNIRTAVVAQLLSAAALIVLAFFMPPYAVMLIFLFVFSSGQHIFLTLADSIGLSLAEDKNAGRALGRFNSARMGFIMAAGIITFVGFRAGFFNFNNPITVFLLSAICFAAVGVLLMRLKKLQPDEPRHRGKLLLKRKYLRYYVICALYGGRKQIMIVYSPWVLIELLGFRADSMSILAVIGAAIGIFFMPMVGRWIDRFGTKRVMEAEALAFIAIYIAYGVLSKSVAEDRLVVSGLVLGLVYLLNIIDRMTAQFGMVRSIYMRNIAERPEDVTPSLSMGMSIDHVVAIAGSAVCGAIWYNFGPEYVFIVAGVMSLGNLIVAKGIHSPVK